MRAADVATASFLMILGTVVLVEAIRLGFRWGPDGPQSGFFPFWLAVVVILHSAAILVRSLRKRSTEPFATLDGARMSKKKMFFSSARAVEELGYAPRPARQALIDAIAWFKANGYVR